jgi:hypothetical protein
LKNLPKTLDETYERILLSIDQDYREIVLEALRWLCFSTKVMTVAELAEASVFSTFVEHPPESAPLKVSFDKDYFFADPLDILGLLSGLVICVTDPDSEDTDDVNVLQDDDGTEPTPESRPKSYTTNSKALLSHFSVKEYLVSGRLGRQVECFAMDEVCSHQILATNCIYFILFSQESGSSDEYPGGFSKAEESFIYYAETKWVEYTRKAEYESRLVNLIVFILAVPHQLRAGFLKFLHPNDQGGRARDISPLYLAAYGTLYFPCRLLIEKGADIDAQGGWYGSAIQAAILLPESESASESLRLSIVKLLLDHGANVNAQGGHYNTALQAASIYGYESIVKLLLGHGANVNTQGGFYGTALQAASAYGHESLAKLLLDYNANVNARGGYYKSPLTEAIRGGHHSIIRQLLDHGAEVETDAGYYDKDLIGFTYVEQGKVAVALLEHGAVVSDFRGGVKAEEALERRDFRAFVDIQEEHLVKERRREREETRNEREEEEIEGITNEDGEDGEDGE